MTKPTIDGVSRPVCHACVTYKRDAYCPVCDTAAPVVEPTNELREHCKQCAEVVKTWSERKKSCLGGAPVVERQDPVYYVLAKQTAVEVPGQDRKELGYTLFDGIGVFSSAEEVHAAIAELGLPLGWVSMTVDQLLPGYMMPKEAPPQLAELQAEIEKKQASAEMFYERQRLAETKLKNAQATIERQAAEIAELKGFATDFIRVADHADQLPLGFGAALLGRVRAAVAGRHPSHNQAPADCGTHPHNDGLEDYRK